MPELGRYITGEDEVLLVSVTTVEPISNLLTRGAAKPSRRLKDRELTFKTPHKTPNRDVMPSAVECRTYPESRLVPGVCNRRVLIPKNSIVHSL